jgi:flagellar M-ring protein FliF
VRSEELMEEVTEAKAAGGIPGTLANQPPEDAVLTNNLSGTDQVTQLPPSRSSKRELRNYEMDKTISHIKEMPGTLSKLSVAVVVDYRAGVNDQGDAVRQPLSEIQMAEITSLVKEAVGFNEERGDRLNVVNASFIAAPEMEPMAEPSLLEQEWVWRAGKILLSGIAVLLVIFTVLRPLMQASSAPPPALSSPGAQPPNMEGYGMASQGMAGMPADQVTLSGQQHPGLPGGMPGYQQQLSMARSMVDGEPERVAHVVKNWVASDG